MKYPCAVTHSQPPPHPPFYLKRILYMFLYGSAMSTMCSVRVPHISYTVPLFESTVYRYIQSLIPYGAAPAYNLIS